MRRLALFGAALAATVALERASAPAATAPPSASLARSSSQAASPLRPLQLPAYRSRPQLPAAPQPSLGTESGPTELRVIDETTGLPLDDCVLELDGVAIARCDNEGSLAIELEDSKYTWLIVAAKGYRSSGIDTHRLSSGLTEIRLAPLIPIRIVNRTGEDGDWTAEIRRLDVGSNDDFYCWSQSTLCSVGVVAGVYAVSLVRDSEMLAFTTTHIDPMHPEVIFERARPTTLEVRVLDRGGGLVADSYVEVSLLSAPGGETIREAIASGKTDARGIARIPAPRGVEVELTAHLSGIEAASHRIVVSRSHERADLRITGALIRCTLVDDSGQQHDIRSYSIMTRYKNGNGSGRGGVDVGPGVPERPILWQEGAATMNVSLAGAGVRGEALLTSAADSCRVVGVRDKLL